MVLGKMAAFGVLMYLAAVNRRRYGRGIAAAATDAQRGFQRTAFAEWTVLAVVLVATALMTALYAPEHLEGAFGSHLLEPHDGSSPAPPASEPQPNP
jgi:hypothetical protein